MHLTLSFFFVCFFISSSFGLNLTNSWLRSFGVLAYDSPIPNDSDEAGRAVTDNTDENDDDNVEDSDFEEDEFEDLTNLLGSNDRDVYSVTHLHEEQGEILVSCFGMWWPVGGPSYDYGGDYYGDYKKKRRRSKKQKKAAKMKRKKS